MEKNSIQWTNTAAYQEKKIRRCLQTGAVVSWECLGDAAAQFDSLTPCAASQLDEAEPDVRTHLHLSAPVPKSQHRR